MCYPVFSLSPNITSCPNSVLYSSCFPLAFYFHVFSVTCNLKQLLSLALLCFFFLIMTFKKKIFLQKCFYIERCMYHKCPVQWVFHRWNTPLVDIPEQETQRKTAPQKPPQQLAFIVHVVEPKEMWIHFDQIQLFILEYLMSPALSCTALTAARTTPAMKGRALPSGMV